MEFAATSILDRRRFPRQVPKEGIQVWCRPPGKEAKREKIALSLLDLSRTGMRFLVGTSIANGQSLAVELLLPESKTPVRLQGEVVWISPISDNTSLVGLRWSQLLNPEVVDQLTFSLGQNMGDTLEEDAVVTQFLGRGQKTSGSTQKTACLVHIYPKGPEMGRRFVLGHSPLIIGRDASCDIPIREASVSRRHACIQPAGQGYELLDLQSTNGTHVNDTVITSHLLKDGDYVHVGECIFRYLEGGNVEADYHEEIYRLTIMDALTGIANKRCLLEFLDRELSRSCRHNRPLTLIMFDLDHFKSINDRFGHLGGDATLRELANLVKREVRNEEMFARYGGEEFAIVLPETDAEGGLLVAQRIREMIECHLFNFDNSMFQITISLGLGFTQAEPDLSPLAFIGRADKKLYQAKANGRNCVVV